jgi:hypothetical protein
VADKWNIGLDAVFFMGVKMNKVIEGKADMSRSHSSITRHQMHVFPCLMF